jgi:hypothetical protein
MTRSKLRTQRDQSCSRTRLRRVRFKPIGASCRFKRDGVVQVFHVVWRNCIPPTSSGVSNRLLAAAAVPDSTCIQRLLHGTDLLTTLASVDVTAETERIKYSLLRCIQRMATICHIASYYPLYRTSFISCARIHQSCSVSSKPPDTRGDESGVCVYIYIYTYFGSKRRFSSGVQHRTMFKNSELLGNFSIKVLLLFSALTTHSSRPEHPHPVKTRSSSTDRLSPRSWIDLANIGMGN